MRRVLGIVPARGGSKRVPRKNLRSLGGKPLVVWALEAALRARSLSAVVLSSDDEEVLALGAAMPGVRALRRPAEISGDTAPAIDYVRHALGVAAADGEAPYDAVVIVQPSSPFTTGADIDAVTDLLFRSGADSAASIVKLDHAIQPAKLKRLDGDKLVPYLEEEGGRMAEHELPTLYVRNGSVYAALSSTVASGVVIGRDCRGYVMPRERSIDINDELDFDFAAFLMGQRR